MTIHHQIFVFIFFLFGSASDYHEQTADSPERWQPVQLGLAAQLVFSEEKNPQQATEKPMERYPQGCLR